MSIEHERTSLQSPTTAVYSAPISGIGDVDAVIVSYLSDCTLEALANDPRSQSHPLLATDAQTWHYGLCRRASTRFSYGIGVPYRIVWSFLFGSELPHCDTIGTLLDRTAKWVDSDTDQESSILGYYTWHPSILEILYHIAQGEMTTSDDWNRFYVPTDSALVASLGRGCTQLYDMLQDGLDKPKVMWIEVIKAMAHDPEARVLGNHKRHERLRPLFPTLDPSGFLHFYKRYWLAGLVDITRSQLGYPDRAEMCKRVLNKCMLYPGHANHMARVVTIVYAPSASDYKFTTAYGLNIMFQSPLRPEDDTVGLINAYNAIKLIDQYATVSPSVVASGFIHTVRTAAGAESYVAQTLECMSSDEASDTLLAIRDLFLGELSLDEACIHPPRVGTNHMFMIQVYIRGWCARCQSASGDILDDEGIQWILHRQPPRIELTYDSMTITVADSIYSSDWVILAVSRSPGLVKKMYRFYGPLGRTLTQHATRDAASDQRLVYDGSYGFIRNKYKSVVSLVIDMSMDPYSHPKSLEYVVDLILPLANGIDVLPTADERSTRLYTTESKRWYVEEIQATVIRHVMAISELKDKAVADTRGEAILRQLMRFFPNWAEPGDLSPVVGEDRDMCMGGMKMYPTTARDVVDRVYKYILRQN